MLPKLSILQYFTMSFILTLCNIISFNFINIFFLLFCFYSIQVQTGLRLPLTGLAPPRLLMCSASMGAEGSVTLQLREAVQAPISDSTTINNALTIGYPDPEILADVLGTFQAAGSDATYDIVTSNRQQQNAQFFKTANNITTIKQETGELLLFFVK